MTKKELRTQLAKIISALNEIIFDTSKQTRTLPELVKHRQRLERLLKQIEAHETIDWDVLVVIMYRVAECLHKLVF